MRRLVVALGIIVFGLWPLTAFAHPHIFIDAKAAITFNDAGEVMSVHNTWLFDQAYSAWSLQGLDTNHDGKVSRAELQPLADDNMDGLAEYEYYTFAGEGKGANLKFGHGSHPTIDDASGQTTLNFDVALEQPYTIRKQFELAVNDPEYYVAITFKDASAVSLINAPKNCSVAMQAGHTMPDAIADELYALPADVHDLPPGLAKALLGVQGSILINCPGGSATGRPAGAVAAEAPATALDAVTDLGATPPPATPAIVAPTKIPFGAAPPELGLNLPRTGVLGWVSQKQQDFYMALSLALAALKTDSTAFWVLGGLSFLYGIFHAAGPGHGKVVISSYVLANEAQVRRGILLSFLSAMLQSLVAIGFVLVAASVLGMTSMAMSNAANWIGILSYGMVALLGLWLMLRKIFGWGHTHEHEHHDEEPRQEVDFAIKAHMSQARAHALLSGDPAYVAFALTGADAYGRLPTDPHYGHSHAPPSHGRAPDDHDHEHLHVVTPAQMRGGWREQLGVVVAVGIRPCSGALIVLAFALSQGLLLAGMAAVLLMGLGTAITTGALASLAAGFKGVARRLAGADNKVTGIVVWWAELLAAVCVFGFGIVLLLASL
jgi:nickel/cobalt transporter (NicO) family protein